MTTSPVPAIRTLCCAPEMCPTCTDEGGHLMTWHSSPVDSTRYAFAGGGRVKLVELPAMGTVPALYLGLLEDRIVSRGAEGAEVLGVALAHANLTVELDRLRAAARRAG